MEFDRDRLDLVLERAIFGLCAALLALGPILYGAVEARGFGITAAICTAMVLVWVLRIWIRPGGLRLLFPPVCWAVLAFVVYAIFGFYRAAVPYPAGGELLRIIFYALLFFTILNNLQTPKYHLWLAYILLAVATVLTFVALYQFVTHTDRVWDMTKPAQYLKRGSGTYICPNHFAGFLEVLLPMGIALTLTSRVNHVTRVLLGYASIAIAVGVGVSISRGAWISCGLSVLILFAVLIRRNRFRVPVLIATAITILIGGAILLQSDFVKLRFQRMLKPGNIDNIESRAWLWKAAAAMWRDAPWLGRGPGQFDVQFPAYRPESFQSRPVQVHNDYLNVLVDWGVAGFAIIASAWLLLGHGIARSWRYVARSPNDLKSRSSSNRFTIVVGGSVGLIALLFHSFVDFNMYIPANAAIAVAFMAIVASYFRLATDRWWIGTGWIGRVVLTVILFAAVAFVGSESWNRVRENHWLRRAARAPALSQERVEALDRAHAIAPFNPETPYQIGEIYRLRSWKGETGYQALAEAAMDWYRISIASNPFDMHPYMRLAMSLDWIGKHEAAEEYYRRAFEADPNNFDLIRHYGWHFLQMRDYESAKRELERSLKIRWWDNRIANYYLEVVNRRLANPSPLNR